jgi:hypothetical protein
MHRDVQGNSPFSHFCNMHLVPPNHLSVPMLAYRECLTVNMEASVQFNERPFKATVN